MKSLEAQLVQAGMTPREAARKESLFARSEAALETRGPERHAFFVPGRIEVLGKHTDYAGGRSLLCAAERGICLVAAPRSDQTIVLRDVAGGVEDCFTPGDRTEAAPGSWTTYGRTVARRIAANFPGADRGAEIVFASDLPGAAGLGSSSALITGFFAVLAEINQLPSYPAYRRDIRSAEALADYLGAVENGRGFESLGGSEGVGTRGGSQDHTAILLSAPGCLVQYAFAPVEREAVIPFPPGYSFVIGCSGVAAEKTGSAMAAYNRVGRITSRILDGWCSHTRLSYPSLLAAVSQRDAHQQMRDVLRQTDDEEFGAGGLLSRLEQVVMESNVLIPDAALALKRNDLDAFGATVDLSQTLAERLLGNQVDETVALARSARELGAVAASAFGAGYGGSVWAMVKDEEAAEFSNRWASAYGDRFPSRQSAASFVTTKPGPPLTRLSI